MNIAAVVVAAGSSRRMGVDKLWLPLAGRPVVAHCLRVLDAADDVAEIVLVVREEERARFAQLARDEGLSKLRAIVAGGAERQDSVSRGLDATGAACDLALIHDAARPMVTHAIIRGVAGAAIEHGAAVCGSAVVDTIKEVDGEQWVVRTPPRSSLMAVQTPQVFRRELILDCYRRWIVGGSVATDDTAVVEHFGHRVKVVPFTDPNPKVTHPGDIEFIEMLMRAR